jgi:hypothetical protein
MKKLFWVKTALVTLGGISVTAADVSISGNTRFRYHAWSNDIASGAGRNNSAFADDLQLWVNADMAADSGLEYGSAFRMRAAGTVDRNYIYLRDDWGQLTLGRNWGPEYSISLGADWRGRQRLFLWHLILGNRVLPVFAGCARRLIAAIGRGRLMKPKTAFGRVKYGTALPILPPGFAVCTSRKMTRADAPYLLWVLGHR